MERRTIAIALVAATAAASCLVAPARGGTIRSDRLQSSHISLGDSYPAVGAVALEPDIFGEPIGFASLSFSSVLISPSWLLTAAHCVDALGNPPHQDYFVLFVPGDDAEVGIATGQWYVADNWISHPNWNGNPANGYDIGLIHLSTPVTGITPAVRYTGSDELTRTATFVGYGSRGTGDTGGLLLDGLRRAGNNVLDWRGTDVPSTGGGPLNADILLSDFDSPINSALSKFGSSIPLDLEYAIAEGDSGGGAFVDFGAGPRLVGIHSFVGAFDPSEIPSGDGIPDSSYGDIVGITRVSAYNAWIDATMTSVPEPTFTASLLIVCALSLRRGRR